MELMSDSEKYEIQGRAHAGLKEAKSNIATLRTSLLAYAKRMEEASLFLKRFADDPLAEAAFKSTGELIKDDVRNLRSSSFENNVDELIREVKRARELQEQIDNF